MSLFLAVLVALTWLGFSLGGALLNPALGSSFGSRFAEWARTHGASSIVNWVENEWYKHHAPAIGGTLPPGSIKVPSNASSVVSTQVSQLPKPAPIVPFASPVIPGEGEWSAAGRTVNGVPAIYVTTLRPDAVHTSYVVGVAWMDTKLLSARLYSGSWIPGGGPYPFTAPVQSAQARTLVAAFNAGFLMDSANGGYYTNHKMEKPLRAGAASFVVYSNGTSNIVAWGSSTKVTSNIASVRQNLDLLVNNAKPVPGLQANDTTKWGATLGNSVYVWRSGLGVTSDGALVYVGGPGLNITDLANLLVRAGAVRAMELDINTDWVNYSYYAPSPLGLAGASNGRELLGAMTGTPARYFESWWARDFITMSARTP
ncbi:MAG TPA: phosphodiester glycosidase family protein [Acidimicrobiales bacterium]